MHAQIHTHTHTHIRCDDSTQQTWQWQSRALALGDSLLVRPNKTWRTESGPCRRGALLCPSHTHTHARALRTAKQEQSKEKRLEKVLRDRRAVLDVVRPAKECTRARAHTHTGEVPRSVVVTIVWTGGEPAHDVTVTMPHPLTYHDFGVVGRRVLPYPTCTYLRPNACDKPIQCSDTGKETLTLQCIHIAQHARCHTSPGRWRQVSQQVVAGVGSPQPHHSTHHIGTARHHITPPVPINVVWHDARFPH